MTRISEDLADLDLLLQEANTGRAYVKIGIGGTERILDLHLTGYQPKQMFLTAICSAAVFNLTVSGRLAVKTNDHSLLTLADPWLFDRPLFGKVDFYYRHISYDDFRHTRPVNELDVVGTLTFGFVTGLNSLPLCGYLCSFQLGASIVFTYGAAPS